MVIRNYFSGSKTGDLPSDCEMSQSPLDACPDSPNCLRVSRIVNNSPEELFETVLKVLQEMRAEEISPDRNRHFIGAVFCIPVFRFRDDVTIAIENANEGSLLHIRSASRVGYSDLGVNRRRVHKLLKKLDLQ